MLKNVTFKDLFDSQQLINITLESHDGARFGANLELVATDSPFFRPYLSHPYSVVVVPGVDKETLSEILNFIYTGYCTFREDTVAPLARAAEFLKLHYLHELCKEFLGMNLSPHNCVKRLRFAIERRYDVVIELILNYMQTHFQQVYRSNPELFDLGWREMSSILGSDILNVSKEDMVFDAVVKWVEHEKDYRIKDLPKLISCVRTCLLDRRFFEEKVATHPLMSGEDSQLFLLQANQLFDDIENSEVSHPTFHAMHPFLRPRVPSHLLFVTGGWSAGSATNVMETYDDKTNRWFLSMTSDTVPRAYHGMVWLEGHIYVVGGFDGNQCFNSVRRFDPTSGFWEEQSCMHEARCYVSVATLPPLMYAMGGYDGHRRARTCEKFDPSSNQWTFVADMHHIRSDASADSLDGKVYIAGGFNGTMVLDSAEYYDPDTNEWTLITRMLSPRSGIRLAALRCNIYVIGGFNGNNRLNTVEKYDRTRREWSLVSEMNSPRSNFAAAVIGENLYAIGGFNGLSTISAVERYDPSRNSWEQVMELNLNRSALAACPVWGIPNARDFSFLGNVMY